MYWLDIPCYQKYATNMVEEWPTLTAGYSGLLGWRLSHSQGCRCYLELFVFFYLYFSVLNLNFKTNIKSTNHFSDKPLLLAKWLVGWYSFGLFTTLINVVIVFMHPFLPESPRWLITEKKYAEAASLINKIRKTFHLKKNEKLTADHKN